MEKGKEQRQPLQLGEEEEDDAMAAEDVGGTTKGFEVEHIERQIDAMASVFTKSSCSYSPCF